MTGGAMGVSEWEAGRLVAARELTEAFRRKAVWVTAALFLLGSTAMVVLPDLLGSDGPSDRSLEVFGDAPAAVVDSFEPTADAADIALDVRATDDLDAATGRVTDGDVDALVRFDTEPPTVVVADEDDQRLMSVVRESIRSGSLVDGMASAGLDGDETAELLVSSAPVVEVLDTEQGGRQFAAFVAAFVTYVLLLLLAMQIANGVAIEKSSRVSEVLLAIVPVRALLFGKVVGIGLIGLVTLTAGAIPIAIRIVTGGSVPAGAGSTLAATLPFSLLGIALYLCLAGSLGALVERTEDVSSSVGPLTGILIVGYLVGQVASDTVVGLGLALLPLTSPMVMPARVALGEATPVEVVVSLVLLVAAVALAARFATTVYHRAIVRTGQKLSLRDLRAPAARS